MFDCQSKLLLPSASLYLSLCEGESVVVSGAAIRLLEFYNSVHSFASHSVHHLAHILLHLSAVLVEPGLRYEHARRRNVSL